ncbi:MAG: flagellar protein FlbD [Ruminococcus sp.]|nr:flagellar protein FlbD [Ruminococcus sp.]
MIILNKLNGEEFALNDELIETIIETPDTTIRLTNGNVYLASQPMREIIDMIAQFKGKCIEYADKDNAPLDEDTEE